MDKEEYNLEKTYYELVSWFCIILTVVIILLSVLYNDYQNEKIEKLQKQIKKEKVNSGS